MAERGLCVRCATDHRREGCQRLHWPNTEGARGECHSKRCRDEGAPAGPLPLLCVQQHDGELGHPSFNLGHAAAT